MKIIRYGSRLPLSALVVLLAAVLAIPATAQDDQAKKEVKREIKVMVDDEGNITVNGKPAKAGDEIELEDGTKARVLKEDGKVIVMEEDDEGGRKVIRRRVRTAPDDDVEVFVKRMKDGDHMTWHVSPGEIVDHARRMGIHGIGPVLDHDFDFDFSFDGMSPEIMELESEAREIARKASKAEGAERAQLERELSEKLNVIFDKKLEKRRERMTRLEEKLAKERAELAERSRSREAIIDRRKADLLGDDVLKW